MKRLSFQALSFAVLTLAFVLSMFVIVADHYSQRASNHDLKARVDRVTRRFDEEHADNERLLTVIQSITSPEALALSAASTKALVDHAVQCITSQFQRTLNPSIPPDETCP